MKSILHNILFITAVTLFIVCGCKSDDSGDDAIAEKTISIDVKGSGATIDFNDVFSSLGIIPLSEESDAIINPRCIWKYAFSDSLMVFINVNMPNQIVIFDSAGKWLKTIDGCGTEADEYLRLEDALINEGNGTLDILDGIKIIQYDLHNDFSVKNVYRPHPSSTAPYYSFTLRDDGEYVLFSANDDGKSSLQIFNPETTKTVNIDYNYPQWVEFSGDLTSERKFINLNGETLFHEGYNGSLYRIDERSKKLKKYLEFDFGDNNFKLDVVKPDKDCFYYTKAFKKDLTRKYALPVFFEAISSTIYIRYIYNADFHMIVYDIAKDSIKCFDKVAGLTDISPCGITTPNAMFTAIPAEMVIKNIDPNILDEENRKKFESLTEDSNLVVLKYTFKN